MKKAILLAPFTLMAFVSFSQIKVFDTTVQLLINLNDYRALVIAINKNIDSKSVTNELVSFLEKSAAIYKIPDNKAEKALAEISNIAEVKKYALKSTEMEKYDLVIEAVKKAIQKTDKK